MNIVVFSNPDFFGDQIRPKFSSMPRFTKMMADGMEERGHHVEIWAPKSSFFNLPLKGSMKKWMGYIDQYIVFPARVHELLKECSADTLFVFTDQAQGPWVPLVANRHHVVHCHDFLAQASASGKITDIKISWTGRQYQNLIRKGLTKGKHFISGSKKTQDELLKFFPEYPLSTDVVYNGIVKTFAPFDLFEARVILGKKVGLDLRPGYILHVGNNQWYKNRSGVIEIYNAWRTKSKVKLPLLLVGEGLSPQLAKTLEQSPFKNDIHIICKLVDQDVRLAYAGASVFVFPSLAEGFGWPIAEAMVCGCLVITTDEAPMSEVAGDAGFLIPLRPDHGPAIQEWAVEAAKVVSKVIDLSDEERHIVVEAAINNAKRFDHDLAMNSIEVIYQKIVNRHTIRV
ncbi:glycosyltransferase [Arcticibacter eurypsychrophilus]|uniref:glycosyltransferase n=1 Tax=Arcticibacter eurypsychrophilus TaxID=1434752 RepID=UPI00084DBD2F|nr:glycosyltransferase [Arcticibacter eurypsychrophilus]